MPRGEVFDGVVAAGLDVELDARAGALPAAGEIDDAAVVVSVGGIADDGLQRRRLLLVGRAQRPTRPRRLRAQDEGLTSLAFLSGELT